MTYTDIRKTNWIEWFPKSFHPFFYLMRLDRPIGTWLLLFPSLWAISLSGVWDTTTAYMALLFSIGALIMRGAGCVINDLWDKDLDQKVERTKSRPLASGAITTRQAMAFLAVLLIMGFVILLQMNVLTIGLGVLSLLFVIVYPFMKRITWWPQAFLGLTFNFGALMGWSAMTGTIELPAILLYVGGFFWTLGYDTIYAYQDVEDDALIGVKSTARLFGGNSKIWIAIFYTVSAVCLMSAVYTVIGARSLLCLPAFVVFYHQVQTLNIESKSQCLRHFKSNRIFGFLFLVGCVWSVHIW